MLSLCCLLLTIASAFAAPNTQIVEGSPAEDCEFPSIVYMRVFTHPHGNRYSICGGTLIDSTHVLTAAHCVEGNIERVEISLGSNKRSTPGAQTRSVSNIVRHSEYVNVGDSPENYIVKNDMALLTMNRLVSEGKCVKFAEMANKEDNFTSSRCITAGWGRLAPEGNVPDKLHKVSLPIVAHDECKKKSVMIISDGILCAGDFELGGASTCQGDSGGPLYCPSSNGAMVLAGVNSFGYECDEDINAFSDVGYFRDWINSHL